MKKRVVITGIGIISPLGIGIEDNWNAFHLIRRNEADVFIAGGTDSMINPIGLGRFSMLESLSMRNDLKEGASRPFDRLRDGMVLGEGSAAIVMESLENAQRRKAHIYAEVVGYGSSLDAYRIPISSSKSMLGHTIAAAGAIEFVATVMSVKSGIIPPTINLINPDPMCDLDYVPLIARKADVKIALSNSFGFGGQNSTLICRKIK